MRTKIKKKTIITLSMGVHWKDKEKKQKIKKNGKNNKLKLRNYNN